MMPSASLESLETSTTQTRIPKLLSRPGLSVMMSPGRHRFRPSWTADSFVMNDSTAQLQLYGSMRGAEDFTLPTTGCRSLHQNHRR